MYRQHRLVDSIELSQQGYESATRDQDPVAATYFLNMLAGAHFASGEYERALDDYLRTRDVALRAGLRLRAAVAFSNLSSLYAHAFDTTSALEAAEHAYRLMPDDADAERRSQVLANLGRILLMRREGDRALRLFNEAIDVSFRAGDTRAESMAWDQMGIGLLRAGDLDRAETALNTAFRIRTFDHDLNLYATQYYLAELNRRRGRLDSARNLIDAAFANRRGDLVQLPSYMMYGTRARILWARGDLRGALADHLRAADAAEEWRSRGLFADSFRISTDVLLQQQALGQDQGIYDGAVETAAELYRQSGDERYAVLAWELNERIRTASLRENLTRGRAWTNRVPPEYWRVCEELRSIEADEFGSLQPSPANRERATRLRLTLAEMEANAGAEGPRENEIPAKAGTDLAPLFSSFELNSQENFSTRLSLTRLQQVLGNSRTLVSFHTGDKISYRWVISNRSFEMKVLPGKSDLEHGIVCMRAALDKGEPEMTPLAERTFMSLFGGIAADRSGRRWLVALDQGLFDLPISALVSRRSEGKPVYLVEDRALELVPGAWAISAEDTSGRLGNEGFIGAGDGIYNVADPRYRSGATRGWTWRDVVPGIQPMATGIRQWPRLVASGREVTECGRRAGTGVTELKGSALNRTAFVAELGRKPRFVHIATHFLWHEGEEKTAIALGLASTAWGIPKLELLTSDDIASLSVPGAIVVMNGCSSSKAEAVPAAGLMGLSRAWLMAGARAVIATLRPMPDDNGELVARFYDHLREAGTGDGIVPAEALRRAQLDMIHSKTWRAKPGYWAAYQLMGRSN